MPAEAAAIPPKPRIAATIATTRNTQAYQSILFSSLPLWSILRATTPSTRKCRTIYEIRPAEPTSGNRMRENLAVGGINCVVYESSACPNLGLLLTHYEYWYCALEILSSAESTSLTSCRHRGILH